MLDLLRLGFLWRPLARGVRQGLATLRPNPGRRTTELRSESLTDLPTPAGSPVVTASVVPLTPPPDLGPGALGTSSP